MYNLANCILFIVLVNQCVLYSVVIAIHWDHSIYLNDDYRLLWSTKDQEITFEVQVKTLGYFGLGFSKDGQRYGSDIVIGWVDQGQTYFHDRHIKKYGDYEPYVDPSQDYTLLLGYENATHTVMRFKRKLDTCDTSHDIPITNDTSRIIYMYHNDEPRHGSIAPGNLPNPQLAFKGYKPLSLIQRFYDEQRNFSANKLHIIELRNQDFELPQSDESVHWCRSFDLLKQFKQKHHLIKFEPVFQSRQHENYIQHIILYECQVVGIQMTYKIELYRKGQICDTPPEFCDAIVAAWYKGSEGLIFPQDVGFPIDASNERYYLMETHYNNPNSFKDIEQLHLGPFVDNSGIRLYITENLRKHDAGVLSIGMDPNWRHIIPPGHEKVISEGHCIDDCTKKAFPPQGISIFAVIMQTHNIGKEVKLRQLRRHEELLPIVTDENIHSQYTEYHKIRPPAKILPGDRMIMECKYNSSMRSAITLGGLQLREERCIALAIYYPRQKRLTTCHSIPSLNTVLHSLGIEKLSMDSSPVRIALPPELTGMLLETRLLSYDWANQFDVFQKVTKSGSFHFVCRDAKGNDLLGNTAVVERYSASPIKVWRSILSNNCNSKITTQLYRIESADLTTLHDYRNIYVTEMVQQNQISDSNSDVESLGLSNNANRLAIIRISSSNKFYTLCYILIYLITWYTI